MEYIRTFDPQAFRPDGYSGQQLYLGESCFVIMSQVPGGRSGPPMHTHPSDQIYYTLEGVMRVQLGSEVFTVEPGTAIFIPAGVPHRNWNEGDVPERHLEIIAPGVGIFTPVMTPTESTDALGLEYYVRPVDPAAFADPTATFAAPDQDVKTSGFAVQNLVTRETGSQSAMIYEAVVEAGGRGPGTHIHPFDQFYFVLEGELTIEVALERHVVKPGHLVVLPAGVPHRQYNASDRRERHLGMNMPQAVGDVRWDQQVEFAARDESA